MILAAAQTKPHRFNLEANLKDHYGFIEQAAEQGAELILFPELSITGYEREEAGRMAFAEDDDRLDGISALSEKHGIVVIAGAPVQIAEALYIGAFVTGPGGMHAVYTKQFLHTGEELVYQASFDHDPLIELRDERIALAVCADITHPEHAGKAAERGAGIYMAGIFFGPKGIGEAHQLLGAYARAHAMCVLMANNVGQPWGMEAGGRSGFWDRDGRLVGQLNGTDPGLLLVEAGTSTFI